MTSDDFLWLKLMNIEGLGTKSLKIIWQTGFPLDKIWELEESEFFHKFPGIRSNVFKNLHNLDNEKINQVFYELQTENIELVHIGGANYPERLTKLLDNDIPLMFFAQGNLELLKSPSIAIVGSRQACMQALEIASIFATELIKNGYNIVSGYAKGVDTSAHSSAIEAGGSTTLVLSYGILEFPKKRGFKEEEWRNSILHISQFPPHLKWNAGNAMRRNAFVCGLSSAVIVVEAGAERAVEGRMSGTFACGETALDMKIPLYVVNPQELESAPAGNAGLIALGGKGISVAEGIDFILSELGNNIDRNEKNSKNVTKQGNLF